MIIIILQFQHICILLFYWWLWFYWSDLLPYGNYNNAKNRELWILKSLFYY